MFKTLERNPSYRVDENGRIFSVRKNRLLTPMRTEQGYLRIQLYMSGKCEYVAVHRLVAETFLPNPNNLPIVNHKDGNKSNNHVSNLEWATQSYNVRHAIQSGLSGEALIRKAIPVEVLDAKGNRLGTFTSANAAEKVTGIRRTHISESCRTGSTVHGLTWRQIPNQQ